MTNRIVIAGQHVLDKIAAHKAANVKPGRYAGTFDSESLCAHQRAMSHRGYLGAEIVASIYGFSLRYDSGLQNWGIIAGTRSGQLDGSLDAAIAYARAWQAQAPDRRYVTTTEAKETEQC